MKKSDEEVNACADNSRRKSAAERGMWRIRVLTLKKAVCVRRHGDVIVFSCCFAAGIRA